VQKLKSYVGVNNPLRQKITRFGLLLSLLVLISSANLSPLHAANPAQPIEDTRVFLPIVTKLPRACPALLSSTRFGVQMYGGTDNTATYYPALVQSGAHWVRTELPWSSVEPDNVAPAQYNWGAADATVGAARDGCLNVVLTTGHAPAWALSALGGADGPLNEANLADFAEYMGALAERYDGDGINDGLGSPIVTYFEIYNEPDGNSLPGVGRWGNYGARYAQMLAAVYPAIKAANPNAKVLLGGIAYDAFADKGGQFIRSFLDDVLNAGGGNHFDIMNFHAYPAFRGNWTTGKGSGLLEKGNAIRAKLQAHGINKPIVITEAGWHSNTSDPNYPGTEELQARYVVELYAQSIAAGIDQMIWFSLYDLDGYPFANGLVTASTPSTKKLGFGVYQVMTTQLNSVQFTRILPQSETKNADMEAYELLDTTTQQKVYVAWMNPVDVNTTVSLRLTGAEVTVIDMVGATSTIKDAADGKTDNHVVVPVTGRPIYVRVIR